MALVNIRKPEFVPPKLQITAMMDMFTIIVFFLMFSYTDQPNDIDLDKDISLPQSQARIDYHDAIKLVLTQSVLKIDDRIVATVSEGQVSDLNPEKPESSALFLTLKSLHEQHRQRSGSAAVDTGAPPQTREEAAQPVQPKESHQHLLFFCDRALPFKTINQVVKTAALAGYANFQLAVLES